MTDPIAVSGAPGSPYTRKMLAVLRYRRIPYRFLTPANPELARLPRPKVGLIPVFFLPDETTGELAAITDSTPIIRRLERDWEGRSVIPTDPGLAFIDALIEDYADEWLTKAMFHYRWAYQADIDKAGNTLPAWRGYSIPDEALAQRSSMIKERQIGRLYVVGSNPVTAPVIEASYERFLDVFEALLTAQPYILGARPSACDFAVFGQLTQLAAFDPTPMALTSARAPRVSAWTGLMEDLSGVEPEADGWVDVRALPDVVIALLAEMGRVYPPVMLANQAAVNTGEEAFETTVEGLPWTQPPFAYQAKCLQWLRADHADLEHQARQNVDEILTRTGLYGLFDRTPGG